MTISVQKPGKPIGYECKHAVYTRARDGSSNDCIAIKEYAVYADGTRVPQMRYRRNYQRSFWITKENFRNHKDKKSWEDLSKLREFPTTQINMVRNICRATNRAYTKGSSLRMLCRDPYIYGCDITTPVLAKREYMKQWPDLISNNRVAALDVESDMVHGHGNVIMGSVTFKEKVKLVVQSEFLKGIHDPERKLREAFTKYLGEYETSRKIKLEIEFVKTAGEIASSLLMTSHLWKPDILAIWNMNFDIPMLVKMLEAEGYDPAEVFSDPDCHPQFKHFKYIEGASQKVTQSGKVMPLHPADRWHTAEFPASFYILDAMCVYKKIRTAKGAESGGYGLDAVLQRNLGIRKLKFEEANHVSGGAWHAFMQKNYPIEYCIYNLFDCIGMELLDEKTNDLNNKISAFCEYSEFSRFPSQPRRTCDDLHFFCLDNNLAIASTSDKMVDELDAYTVSLKHWIVTLSSHTVANDGIHAIEELPDQPTSMRAHNAD